MPPQASAETKGKHSEVEILNGARPFTSYTLNVNIEESAGLLLQKKHKNQQGLNLPTAEMNACVCVCLYILGCASSTCNIVCEVVHDESI